MHIQPDSDSADKLISGDFSLNIDEILQEAVNKTRRLREFRETLQLGHPASTEIENCLALVQQQMAGLMQPETCIAEVQGSVSGDALLIEPDLCIRHRKIDELNHEINGIHVYALSLGYETNAMMQNLDNDYTLYHFHYYVARTCLLLINRRFYKQLCQTQPSYRWHRFPVLVQISEAESSDYIKRHYWDPLQISQLLNLLPATQTRFRATDAGCIAPVFSIVGVMLST